MSKNIDIESFLKKSKTMIIAPAGFGKTHFICECTKQTKGRQLILTHTNSGVASLKEKMRELNVPPVNYNIETISGYCQKYVLAYCKTQLVPNLETERKAYYSFLQNEAQQMFEREFFSKIIKNSYTGLFIDEYQDCTVDQHELLMLISQYLPTRILGDPMQGIFDFAGTLVDLDSESYMGEFFKNKEKLTTPWRWKKQNKAELGNDLYKIRQHLKQTNKPNLFYKNYPSIEYIPNPRRDRKIFWYNFNKILNEEKNVLIIVSTSTSRAPRLNLITQFPKRIRMIESIDEKLFYELANYLDGLTVDNILESTYHVCSHLFIKTHYEKWITAKRIVQKKEPNTIKYQKFKILFDNVNADNKLISLVDILLYMKNELFLTIYSHELFNNLLTSLTDAHQNQSSVYTEMCNVRNRLRRYGRRLQGKCVGTTLLTKGLESDCAVIIGASKFENYKDLYVALTRGTKRIVVFA